MNTVSRHAPSPFSKRLIANRLWVPGAIMVTIAILSGSPGIQTGGWSFTGVDKLGHLVVFGLLGISVARVFIDIDSIRMRVLFISTTIATGFGLLDETRQYFNPLRTFEWADLLADFIGSMTASWLYLVSNRLRSLLEFKFSDLLRLRLRGKL